MTEIVTNAVMQIVILSLPLLVAGLLISLLVGIFQAITQIQDSTISFVPRLVLLLILVIVGLPWFMELLADYTGHLFRNVTFVSG